MTDLEKAKQWLTENKNRYGQIVVEDEGSIWYDWPKIMAAYASHSNSELLAEKLAAEESVREFTQLIPDYFGRMGIVAGIKEWCRQWELVIEDRRKEAQLACDLRSSQDQVIERCAQAVAEKFPEAAAIIRSHADGISGEDWGELNRRLSVMETALRKNIQGYRNLVELKLLTGAYAQSALEYADEAEKALSDQGGC